MQTTSTMLYVLIGFGGLTAIGVTVLLLRRALNKRHKKAFVEDLALLNLWIGWDAIPSPTPLTSGN